MCRLPVIIIIIGCFLTGLAPATAQTIDVGDSLPRTWWQSPPASMDRIVEVLEDRLGTDRSQWPESYQLAWENSRKQMPDGTPAYEALRRSMESMYERYRERGDAYYLAIYEARIDDFEVDPGVAAWAVMPGEGVSTSLLQVSRYELEWYVDHSFLPKVTEGMDAYLAHLPSLLGELLETGQFKQCLNRLAQDLRHGGQDPSEFHQRLTQRRLELQDEIVARVHQRAETLNLAPQGVPGGTFLFAPQTLGNLRAGFRMYLGRFRQPDASRWNEGFGNLQVNFALAAGGTQGSMREHPPTLLLQQGRLQIFEGPHPWITRPTANMNAQRLTEGNIAHTSLYVLVDENPEGLLFRLDLPAPGVIHLTRHGQQPTISIPASLTEEVRARMIEHVVEVFGEVLGFETGEIDLPPHAPHVVPDLPPSDTIWFSTANITASGEEDVQLERTLHDIQRRWNVVERQVAGKQWNLARENLAQLEATLAAVTPNPDVRVIFHGLPTDAVQEQRRLLEEERRANLATYHMVQDRLTELTEGWEEASNRFLNRVWRGMVRSLVDWHSLPSWYEVPHTFVRWQRDAAEHSEEILEAQTAISRILELEREYEKLMRQTLDRHRRIREELDGWDEVDELHKQARAIIVRPTWAEWRR